MRSWINKHLLCDDLIARVIYVQFAVVFGGLGVWVAGWLLPEQADLEPAWLLSLYAVAAALMAYGALLLYGALTPRDGRLARLAWRCHPDVVGEEALIVIPVFIIAFGLPAVLVTLILRWFGLRGHD